MCDGFMVSFGPVARALPERRAGPPRIVRLVGAAAANRRLILKTRVDFESRAIFSTALVGRASRLVGPNKPGPFLPGGR
jgi:hypothetical protein